MSDTLLLEAAPLPGTQPHNEQVEAQVKQFERLVDSYSNNRKDRRKFKKLFGVMPPPKYEPYVKPKAIIEHGTQQEN